MIEVSMVEIRRQKEIEDVVLQVSGGNHDTDNDRNGLKQVSGRARSYQIPNVAGEG